MGTTSDTTEEYYCFMFIKEEMQEKRRMEGQKNRRGEFRGGRKLEKRKVAEKMLM